MFSSEWHHQYAVLTNVGIFIFSEPNRKLPPFLFSWKGFRIETKPASEELDGKRNLFSLFNEEGEERVFSINTRD